MDLDELITPAVISTAQQVFVEAQELTQEKSDGKDCRTTAILTYTDQILEDQPPALVITLGETMADTEKLKSWERNSREKADRLAKNRSHVSAWQSRDFDSMKYGGAVKSFRGDIVSMSGLPEYGDEACCLLVLLMAGRMTIEEAKEIVKISQNDLFDNLYKRIHPLVISDD